MNKWWEISVDTGGTFTDCITKGPDADISYIKVLSSGKVGGKATSKISNNQLLIELNYIDHNLYKGYHLDIPSANYNCLITNNTANGVFDTSTILPEMGSEELIYIYANEQAPILAARIATRTQLSERLPEIKLRLGTTRGTNALLELKGGKTALLITKGFKDLLEIGTQQRPDLFALNIIKRKSLTNTIIEVDESIDRNGKIQKSINEAEILECIQRLKDSNIQSVAIAFKNSYQNNCHEVLASQLIQDALGPIPITCSALLYPAIKYLTRTETAVVNAYLTPVLNNYLDDIGKKISRENIKVMTSAGALSDLNSFNPKDSLLSGPAGGIVGAFAAASALNANKVLTIDMGGTSTDVSRIDNGYDTVSEIEVGNAHLFTQAIAIETVAAGGGSICSVEEGRLMVGPASAGASPGPACYGNKGPITVTDLNLLSGRVDTESFSFPLDTRAAREGLKKILDRLLQTHPDSEYNALISGFLAIANQKMADAVKKISINRGFNPKDYQLLGFGGAIGQHICDIAKLLSISSIIVPYSGSLLSAAGIANALIEKSEIKQLLISLDEKTQLIAAIEELKLSALEKIKHSGVQEASISSIIVHMRLKGQDTTLDIPFTQYEDLKYDFKDAYVSIFGHWVEREIEIESIRVSAKEHGEKKLHANKPTHHGSFNQGDTKKILFADGWQDAKTYEWAANLISEETISGPAIITNPFTSIIINPGWVARLENNQLVIADTINDNSIASKSIEAVELALFTNRFKSVAEQMGSLLQRTALSVNIKERLDFSCALLDKNGRLVVNAPHIPVHLGSLGICTRAVINELKLSEGDVAITNHPAYGGSHLPDVTLIAPVFYRKELIGYVANRAHHAEIGGKAPGSMPADAANLAEEGVVIPPRLIVSNGKPCWDDISNLLSNSRYPSRAVADNLADFQAAVASIIEGQKSLISIAEQYGMADVLSYMDQLSSKATRLVEEKFDEIDFKELSAIEKLDNGSEIRVKITKKEGISIDFAGTSTTSGDNLNATEAIVNGAVIYVLKLLIGGDIPLNEGLTQNVELKIPKGSILNPNFPEDTSKCPAVVGGNTEVSQRLVDTLLKAFNLVGCSQGTMNNFLFGSNDFGYYETICGGTGAGNGFNGADAVHQHMTNTQITDPEILEYRYPVELKEFSVRNGSGGKGLWHGGNGVVRSFVFKEPVVATILSQHRKELPYGLAGGGSGLAGKQEITSNDISTPIEGVTTFEVKAGDTVTIYTPGGGGYGSV
jgi:5-oxoprolinase (ATP-hydrolysing)